jgi:two-component system, OmpR family, response regulator
MKITPILLAAVPPQHSPARLRPPAAVDDQCSQPTRILVISDNTDDNHATIGFMNEHGLQAVCWSDSIDVKRRLLRDAPSLIVLEMAEDHNQTLGLLAEVKSQLDVPVIVVEGHRSDRFDHATALELGADDCLARPFSLRELVARIRAILRRGRASGLSNSAADKAVHYRFGPWQFNRRTQRLTGPQDATVALTKGQSALLLAFLDAPQRPLSREQLLQATRVHEDVFDRSIDVQVLRVRRRLETEAGAQRIIETERGVGYVFTLPVERD